jgi:hypothetical protein
MGLHKAEKPMNSKEFVWPAIMIVSTANTVKPFALAQDAPKTSAYPFIHYRKGRFVTMLEIFEPAPQGTIDIFDDDGQTAAVTALGFGANGVPELFHTFRAGPPHAPLEMVTEKVKTFSGNARIYNSGLVRVQGKSSFCGQFAEEFESPVGFGITAAQDYEIVRITDHFIACRRHSHIDRVQIEIGEQRAYDSMNAKDNFEFSRIIPCRDGKNA